MNEQDLVINLGSKVKGRFITLTLVSRFCIWRSGGRDLYLGAKFMNSLPLTFYYEKIQTKNSFGGM